MSDQVDWSQVPVARRADSAGEAYRPHHPQFFGSGLTRSCGACGKHRALGPGWGNVRVLGQVCPDCMALRAARAAEKAAEKKAVQP